jgi:ankyrin repeat protein
MLLRIPVEILLTIALLIEDDGGGFSFADFNSLLKANRALYNCLNRTLWKKATESEDITERVFTHLIRTNHLERLEFFLELGANTETLLREFYSQCGGNEHNYSNVRILEPTPLKVAAHLDNVPMAHLLLKHGADVVQYDELGHPSHSAIHVAQSAEMVQLLLDHHAYPEQRAFREPPYRPLHYYAIRNNVEAMEAILRNGAKVDPTPDIPSQTPLHVAARRKIEAVKLLVEYGADVTKRNRASNTPLHMAARAEKVDVVKLLVERWPEGLKERGGMYENTPLHSAAGIGSVELVKFLLEIWPDGIREKNVLGNTPLHMAAGMGMVELVKLLVEFWPDGIREMNHTGNTPLHTAAALGKIDVVRFLVECWPEGREAPNGDGDTPVLAFAEGRRQFPEAHAHLGAIQNQGIIALLCGLDLE